MDVVNLDDKYAKFSDHWSPKIIARFNDLHIKAVKIKGEFVWHAHEDTDEMFLVNKGSMTICFRDRNVQLNAGDLLVVPKGTEHKPVATEECEILIIEPLGTVNTGDAGGDLTVREEPWI